MKIRVETPDMEDLTYLYDYINETINSYDDKLGFLQESYSKLLEILVCYKKLNFGDLNEILFTPNDIEIEEYDW